MVLFLKIHLSKHLRTTLLLEAKTRGMALHHKPMVVVVTTFHHGTRTGTKMVTTTTTTTKVMVAGAARSKGIKTGIFAEALVGEMEMHIHKEAPQHLWDINLQLCSQFLLSLWQLSLFSLLAGMCLFLLVRYIERSRFGTLFFFLMRLSFQNWHLHIIPVCLSSALSHLVQSFTKSKIFL